MSRLSEASIEAVLEQAIRAGHLDPPHSAAVFYDLWLVDARLEQLQRAFGPDTLHAFAIKACPLARVLERIVARGFGLEAASLPEVRLAEAAGAPPHAIVFDSPAKTHAELQRALARGLHVNADSLAELDRIAELIAAGVRARGTIGVRVNPQVGVGTIAATSVAGEYSKFGVPLLERREQLIERFAAHAWLTGLHVHVGSQGCELAMLIDGIARVVELADDIDARLATPGRVTILDIGGGLPVAYRPDDAPPTIEAYAESLAARFPELAGGRFRLMTEFGRWVVANAGWVASRVEYVKPSAATKTAIVHVGADMFLRKCYAPSSWHHQILAFTPDGRLKSGRDDAPYVVAGPLCFAGDVLGSDLQLPPLEPGDILVIQDAGAYTLSMWSRYNSRQVPRVLGYAGDDAPFEILRERDTLDDVAGFWGR